MQSQIQREGKFTKRKEQNKEKPKIEAVRNSLISLLKSRIGRKEGQKVEPVEPLNSPKAHNGPIFNGAYTDPRAVAAIMSRGAMTAVEVDLLNRFRIR